ncbi:MAG: serine/threonine-protein kinase [Myxococcota bacterium]
MHLDVQREASRAHARAVLFGDEPTTRVGRYVVLSRLGQGGMGVVWSAIDERLDRKVALKLVHPDATEGAEPRAQLLREARALAKLQHENVVAVHDVGEHDGDVFVAMELVRGENLRAWAQGRPEHPRPSASAIEGAIIQAARGVAAAHRAGIIHRDLKPENILVGEDGRVRVADFGLARAIGPAQPTPAITAGLDAPISTTTGRRSIGGTPAYMAPEAMLGQRAADEASDQWSLAASAVEALTGKRPYAGETLAELVAAFERKDGPAELPKTPFGAVLSRALALDPAQRYPSMQAFEEALVKTQAAPTSPIRIAGLVAGALVLAAVVGLVVSADRAEDCSKSSDLLSAWDAAARDKVKSALSGAHQSSEMIGIVSKGFDDYRAALTAAAAQSCQARNQRLIHEAERDRRRVCLERARVAAAGLIERVEKVSPQGAGNVAKALMGLPDPSVCNDPQVLALTVPVDPSARAAVNDVITLTQDADQQRILGDPKAALETAKSAVKRAEDAKNDYALATAVHAVGQAQFFLGDTKATAEYLHAMELGLASGNDEIAVQGLQSTAYHAVEREQAFEKATLLARIGEALAQRLPPSIRQRNLDNLLNVDCVVAMRTSRFEDGKRLCGDLAKRREAMFGADHPATASALINLAGVYTLADEPTKAVEINSDVVQRLGRSFGAKHPLALRTKINLASDLAFLGRTAEARALAEKTLAEEVEVFGGEENNDVMTAYAILTEVALAEKRPELALKAAQRGLEIREALEGPDSHLYATGLGNLATVQLKLGRSAEALAGLKRAYELVLKLHGPSDAASFNIQSHYADALVRLHRFDEAHPILERLTALLAADLDVEKTDRHEVRANACLVALARGLGRTTHPVPDLKRWAAEALAFAEQQGIMFEDLAESARAAVAGLEKAEPTTNQK